MPKNLRLMLLSAMVPVHGMHDVELALKEAGASQVMWRPYLNGAETRGPTGQTPGKSNTETGELQQEWLVKNWPKGQASKVVDVSPHWVEAGFKKGSFYSALSRAVEAKLLKRVKPGLYRRGA